MTGLGRSDDRQPFRKPQQPSCKRARRHLNGPSAQPDQGKGSSFSGRVSSVAHVDELAASIGASDDDGAVRGTSEGHLRSHDADRCIGIAPPQHRTHFLSATVTHDSDWHRVQLRLGVKRHTKHLTGPASFLRPELGPTRPLRGCNSPACCDRHCSPTSPPIHRLARPASASTRSPRNTPNCLDCLLQTPKFSLYAAPFRFQPC